MPDQPEIAGLKNLGRISQGWLNAIGIYNEAQLREIGVVEAYQRIKVREPGASLNLLYAMWAALEGLHWTQVPPEVKEQLRGQVA